MEKVMKITETLSQYGWFSGRDFNTGLGRAIAQAVSLWLTTAAARVRIRAKHVGFVVDKVALG
jgi:hypothetical protein